MRYNGWPEEEGPIMSVGLEAGASARTLIHCWGRGVAVLEIVW